ncbi:hypothetical protein [Fodinibius sp. SL11]|uniref:hypothetical protein n=1 Tax=Fodinibius sp. SL11 TaxID=3425690 RepID=UPI003F881A8C
MKTFDLSDEMTDLFGDPLFNQVQVHQLVKPLTLEYRVGENQTESKEISYVVPDKKPQTYRKAIYSALRQAGNAQDNKQISEDFDKDEMGMLMLTLSADSDVELSVEDRHNIIKACKVFADTEVYIQVKQMLDPDEDEE